MACAAVATLISPAIVIASRRGSDNSLSSISRATRSASAGSPTRRRDAEAGTFLD